MDTVQNVLNNLNDNLQRALNDPYVASLLLIFFIFYAGLAAPNLPKVAAKLFDYTLFKVLILALILFINNYNPTVAILVAVGFFLTMQTLSRYKVFDLAGEVSKIRQLVGFKNGGEKKEEEESSEDEVAEDANYGMNLETQVSGLATRTPYYQGPQGMKHPVGFGGDIEGADVEF